MTLRLKAISSKAILFNSITPSLIVQYYVMNFSFVEKYFQGVLILASVLFVLYREALVVERLRRLPRMQEVVGSNLTEGKICFHNLLYFIEWSGKKLFCKTTKSIKIIKTKIT